MTATIATIATPGTPHKLFRDEAQVDTIKCLSCGGPIALHGFGAARRVVCPHCGSVLAPEASGALALLQAVARARRPSILPLHARGVLDDATWEVLGICHRQCDLGPLMHGWQEFLLYNPYRGFRWLVHDEDGHWTLGHDLEGAPEIIDRAHHSVRFADRSYRHFHSGTAVVTYVEGEFTWEVHAGDSVELEDFIAPPLGLSVEQSTGEDGVELNFTGQRHIDAATVWRAFAQPGKPPRERGVGLLRPNRWHAARRSLGLSCLLFLAAWWTISAAHTRPVTQVFTRADLDFTAPFSEEITIGEGTRTTAIELRFTAHPLVNSWAHADILLVDLVTEQAIALGLESSHYDGEDATHVHALVGGVTGGHYLLQIHPERDPGSPDPYSVTPTAYDLEIVQDVPLTRYDALALGIILGVPLLALLLGWAFERRRWRTSDYA